MREGVLYDMLGRGGADDPRDGSIDALMQRYGIDRAQAARVEDTALQPVSYTHLDVYKRQRGGAAASPGPPWPPAETRPAAQRTA